MIKLCDVACIDGGPADEYLWRDKHIDLRCAKIRSDALKMPNGLNLEYLQPTYSNRYNLGLTKDAPSSDVLAQRCADYIAQYHLDGMMLDTPFENMPMPALGLDRCNKIRLACPGKAIMINLGDAATYMGLGKPYGPAGAKAVELFTWLLVEVAVNLAKPWDTNRWKAILAHTQPLLDQGKRVVLGINDEGAMHIDLAMAVMHTMDHENLYWHYETINAPTSGMHVMEYNWHPMMAIARLE